MGVRKGNVVKKGLTSLREETVEGVEAWPLGDLTFSLSRKTRRADIAVSAARTEPVPGAQGAGAPACPSTWEVSDAEGELFNSYHM
jgi:hypothetical protein